MFVEFCLVLGPESKKTWKNKKQQQSFGDYQPPSPTIPKKMFFVFVCFSVLGPETKTASKKTEKKMFGDYQPVPCLSPKDCFCFCFFNVFLVHGPGPKPGPGLGLGHQPLPPCLAVARALFQQAPRNCSTKPKRKMKENCFTRPSLDH